MSAAVILPADGHVHTEWSWDTREGSMERSCARAVELGLPGVAFTEHLDFAEWQIAADDLVGFEHLSAHIDADWTLHPPPLDVDGYLAEIDRCRTLFPNLSIMTGVELGEAHRSAAAAATALRSGGFERVNGSLHTLRIGDTYFEPPGLYRHWPAERVIREYLTELIELIRGFDQFAVLSHLDYAAWYWPTDTAGPFAPERFEEEFREVMRVLADSSRALELNAGRAQPWQLEWWRDAGGRTVSFASDAHDPAGVGSRFAEAAAMAEAHGFGPGRTGAELWHR